MKRCERCNRIFDDSQAFCTNCGASLVEANEKEASTKSQDETSITMESNPEGGETSKKVVKQNLNKKFNKKAVIGIAGVLVLGLIVFAGYYLLGRSRQKERVVYYQDGNLVCVAMNEEPEIIATNYAKELEAEVLLSEFDYYDESIEKIVINNTVYLAGNQVFYLANFDWGETSDSIQADLMTCKLNKRSKRKEKVAHISFSANTLQDDVSSISESEILHCRIAPYLVYQGKNGVEIFYSDEESFYKSNLKKKTKIDDAFEMFIDVDNSDMAFGIQDEKYKIIHLDSATIDKTMEADNMYLYSMDGKEFTVWYSQGDQICYFWNGQQHTTDLNINAILNGRLLGEGKCYYLVSTSQTIAMKDFIQDSLAVEDAAIEEPEEEDYYIEEISEDYSYYQSYYTDLLAQLEENYNNFYDYYEDYYDYLCQESWYYDDDGYLYDYVYYNMNSIDDLDGFWEYLERECTYTTIDWDAYNEAYNQYYRKQNRDYIRAELSGGEYDITLDDYSLYYFDGNISKLLQEHVQDFMDSDSNVTFIDGARTVVSIWDVNHIEEHKNNAMDIKDMDSNLLYDYQYEIKNAITQQILYVTENNVKEMPLDYSSDMDRVLVTKDCQLVLLKDFSNDESEIQIYEVANDKLHQQAGIDFIYYDYSGLYWIEKEDGSYDLYDGLQCIKKHQYDSQQMTRYPMSEDKVLYLFNEDYYGNTKDAMIYDTKQDVVLYEIEGMLNFDVLENGTLYYTKQNGNSYSGRVDLYYYMDSENKGKIDVDVAEFVVDRKTN